MSHPTGPRIDIPGLRAAFGERLVVNVPLGRYTAARVGGPADAFLHACSSSELANFVCQLWKLEQPFLILGGGSNVLVSDSGVRGVVVLNRSKGGIRFNLGAEPPTVWAESGVNLASLARRAAARGLSGLEWAAGIPGTLGGAIVGNAGAHGGSIAAQLVLAEILHRGEGMGIGEPAREMWAVDRMEYEYRGSALKGRRGGSLADDKAGTLQSHSCQPWVVVLGAQLKLERSTPEAVQAQMEEFATYRRRTQPSGASIGSMFKNPPADYAGRLIEAAGLKGTRLGGAEISALHANFFINNGKASASDVFNLIRVARERVAEKYGVCLEMEIELVGDWQVKQDISSPPIR